MTLGIFLINWKTKFFVRDEILKFRSLVNQSLSKSQPYHRWARYREAFAGDLVKEIILRQKLIPSDGFIFDPMCGSGSTNVAAKELGFDNLGLDVNPYSVLLTKVKLENYSESDVIEIQNHSENFEVDNGINHCEKSEKRKYFNQQNFNLLQEIHNQIRNIKSEKFKISCLWRG